MSFVRWARVALISSYSVCALSCTGTETGNPPVIDFGNSGCKSRGESAQGLRLQSLDDASAHSDPLYEGLTCITWERLESERVRIGLTNYETGCGADSGWQPRLEQRDDGGLDIVLQDSDCATSSCGWCTYDLSFEFTLPQPLEDGELRVYQAGCKERGGRKKRATVALASQPRGASCSYAHLIALEDYAGTRGQWGKPLMPCDVPDLSLPCEAGSTCTDLGPREPRDFSGGKRCLVNCASDADCDSLSACTEGTCRLRTTSLSTDWDVDP